MRTVKEMTLKRMAAQAEEAETQGLVKVANSLTNQIDNYSTAVRKDDSFYVYSAEEVQADVENKCWDAVIRIADYYDGKFDAADIQSMVEKYAKDLMNDVRLKLGVRHGVGAFEPTVPGEFAERVTIELEEK